MFGEDAEFAPDWDRERKYRAADLQLYVELEAERGGAEATVIPLRADVPMVAQLLEAQPRGYRVPGVPMILIVVRGSEYERRFFLNRLAKS